MLFTFRIWLIFFIQFYLYSCYFDHDDYEGYPDSETMDESITTTKTTPIMEASTTENREIINVTCIVDKYGLGYVGTKKRTYDGILCVNWRVNSLLYARYKMRGKNITENYCRNPDNDSSGPWCFISIKGRLKQQFKFKHCGIPICKSLTTSIPNKLKELNIGVRMFLKRDCPIGFKNITIERIILNITYCQLRPEYVDNLPAGKYSFSIFNNQFDSTCPEGFKLEGKGLYLYCTKTNSESNSIEFPKYLSPNPGDLVFLAIKFENETCPQMSSETSLLIRKVNYMFREKSVLTICHYFYKLSKNKLLGRVNQKLAVLVFQRNCPKNWTSQSLTKYNWNFNIKMDSMYMFQSAYACIPDEPINKYPNGDYCMLNLKPTMFSSNYICPEDFVEVEMEFSSKQNTKFCCRQDSNKENSITDLYEFFNFSYILIINSAGECKKTNSKDVSVKQNVFEALLTKETYKCNNCDLFSVFSTQVFRLSRPWLYYKIQFQVCSYEKRKNGFAYATLNSRCPSDMKYGFIKYAKDRYRSYYSQRITAMFCTILNYPKNISFPEGQYCVYKIGTECPPGFQDVNAKLPLYFFKYSDSGGDITNYQFDKYCCKYNTKKITFENVTLPYVTSNFEFGLPYANNDFRCIHGLDTHTAVEDSHMCHYYPTTDNSQISIVYPSIDCGYRTYRYVSNFRLIYSSRTSLRHCRFPVSNQPPPGNYCAPFSKACPPYFDYITYYPLMQRVICCRKPIQNYTKEIEFSAFNWVNQLKSFSILTYKKECPIFQRYNYGKNSVKRSNVYTATDIGVVHRDRLRDIGFEVTRVMEGFSVIIYSCDYTLNPYNKSITWPHGQYAFPKPIRGCPTNFKIGYFSHSMETANPSFSHSDVIHLDGDYMIGGAQIKWGFCVKKDYYMKDKLYLPYGRYCLMKLEFSCPSNFNEGSVRFVEVTALNKMQIKKEGILPKIDIKGPYITYHFCCQSGRGDVAHQPMQLPIESGPFYLMKFGTYCQKVYGMKFTEEFICIDSEDSPQHLNYSFQAPYKVEGLTPVTGSFVRGCDFQINLCYYELDIPSNKTSTPSSAPLVSWPKGSYVFIKPLRNVCPRGFNEGAVTVFTLFKFYPNFMHNLMFGTSKDNNAIFSFCKRNSSVTDLSRPEENWPLGTYCLIFENRCPAGMLRHKLRSLDNLIALGQSGATLSSWTNLCCKKDIVDDKTSLPYFPGDSYSVIVQPSRYLYKCPTHKDARVASINQRNELICHYERRDESVVFPNGDYLFPAPEKPIKNCPNGFKLVKHIHTALGGTDKPSKILMFCQKDNKGNKNTTTFPRGNYCILTTNNKCPSSQFTIQNLLTIPMYQFSHQKLKYSRYLTCCQTDDKLISNIAMPNQPFRLFGSTTCSYVEGLLHVEEYDEPTMLIPQNGVERPPYIKAEKTLRMCIYDEFNIWNFIARCRCHPNATCVLSFTEQNCKCESGFFGNGKTICSKITSKTDQCGNSCNETVSTCSKPTDSNAYKCICKDGFRGDGFQCKPSCRNRHCNSFQQCIIEPRKSKCKCSPGNIENKPGECYGDLINTLFHINTLDYLNQINLSCFSSEAYNHLLLPNNSRILFIIAPLNKTIFSLCDKTGDFYGFSSRRNIQDIHSNISINEKVITESGNVLTLYRSIKNEWIINNNVKVISHDHFTNAIVLYLNDTILFDQKSDPFSSKIQSIAGTSLIIGYILGGILIFSFIIIIILIINRKKHTFIFGRLYETRSESNIHFINAYDKIEIESE